MERNEALDGLRGFAALNVAIFHTILSIDESLVPRIVYGKYSDLSDAYSWATKIILKIFSGETAVFVFFVISGAVLFQSLMASKTAPFIETVTRFTIRRIFRIYPALIVCLLFIAVLAAVTGKAVNLTDLATNAVLYAFPINSVTWTLNVEMVAVVFILLAFFGWRSAGVAGLLGAAIAIWLFFRIPELPIAVLFKDFWGYFVFGMLIPTPAGNWVGSRLPIWSCLASLVVAIAFKGTIQTIAIALLVTSIYYGRSGAIGEFLMLPISQFLGRISYSFYLYNYIALVYLGQILQNDTWFKLRPIEAGLLASVFTVSLTVPAAYASMRWVELPAIRLGRLLTSWPGFTSRRVPNGA